MGGTLARVGWCCPSACEHIQLAGKMNSIIQQSSPFLFHGNIGIVVMVGVWAKGIRHATDIKSNNTVVINFFGGEGAVVVSIYL